MFQGLAVQILHGNESLPILLADVIDGANVGMVQGRSRLCFTLEAAKRLRVFGHVVRQELERDKAAQPGVLSLIDDPHATAAEPFHNVVVRDGLADHLRMRGLLRRFILRTRHLLVNE